MDGADSHSSKFHCAICRREFSEWLLRISVEDTAGFRQQAFICGNCAVKLRLASEKNRDLQIDPWVHEAVATVLRGKKPDKEELRTKFSMAGASRLDSQPDTRAGWAGRRPHIDFGACSR